MKKRDLIIYLVILFAIIFFIGLVAAFINTQNPNRSPPAFEYGPLVPVPVPLTIVTSGGAVDGNGDLTNPFTITVTGDYPNLVFTSTTAPDVTGVELGGNYMYIFSKPNTTYVEKDNIPVEFEVIGLNGNSAVQSISGGIYREHSSLISLAALFTNPNIRLYDPGLNFGGTHVINMAAMFSTSGIEIFRLQYGAKFGAVATNMNQMFEEARYLTDFIIPKDSPFGASVTDLNAGVIFFDTNLRHFTIPSGAQFGASLTSLGNLFLQNNSLETITIDVDSPFGQSLTSLTNLIDNAINLKTLTMNSAFGGNLPTTGSYSLINNIIRTDPDITIIAPFVLGPQWEIFIQNIPNDPNANVTILSPSNDISSLSQEIQDSIDANTKVTYSSG